MTRDLDLIRTILLKMEASPTARFEGRGFKVEGYTDEQVSYHIKLMEGSGLVIAHDASARGVLCWVPTFLTNRGHDFLDNIKNDTVWNKTKTKVSEVGSAVSLDIITQIATGFMKSLLSLE